MPQTIRNAVGEPLPDHDATSVEILDKNDLEKALEDWAKLPTLQELIDKLGITDKELEGA